jgi:hypothetical protein
MSLREKNVSQQNAVFVEDVTVLADYIRNRNTLWLILMFIKFKLNDFME